MSNDLRAVRRSRGGESFLRDGSRQRFAILGVLLATCALTGGSSQAIVPSLLVLRPVLVLGIGAMVVLRGPWDWRGLRLPALLLALFAATMLVQLVPLPSKWWAAMPGHARYAAITALAPTAARPISLVPDLTVNSLLALLPAVAVLVGYAGMAGRERWNTLWLVLGVAAASAAASLMQAVGGGRLPIVNGRGDESVVTGLFANRNHGAVLLAMALPLMAALLRARLRRTQTRWMALAGVTAIVLPLILLGGSRQGMALGLIAAVVAAAMLTVDTEEPGSRAGGRRPWLLPGALVAALVLLLATVYLSGRAVAVLRLAELADPTDEDRVRNFPIILGMTRDFLPFGIGYGAFDPVYRGYEPDALLSSTYLNRAHDDLLETLLSGGVAAAAVLVGFVSWLGSRIAATVRRRESFRTRALGLAAAAAVVLVLAASLVDYPLRTPIMTAVFALLCCWLGARPPVPDRRRASAVDPAPYRWGRS